MDDGHWLNVGGDYHHMLYRICGEADGFSRSRLSAYPEFFRNQPGWFGYGIVSIMEDFGLEGHGKTAFPFSWASIVDDAKNLSYQPKLSPKWISEDGKVMVLIRSDAQKDAKGDSHSVNYRWNQMKIKLMVES